jgi:fermentation-respiration switch protein FrsA (DUF1100 family)
MGVPLKSQRRCWAQTAVVLLSGVAAWWLLGLVVPAGGERFYLLVPPVALALIGAWSPEPWRSMASRLRHWLVPLGLAFLGGTAYNLLMAAPLYAQDNLLRGLRLSEILAAAYFIFAINVLVLVLLAGLRPVLARLFKPSATPSRWGNLLRYHGGALLLAPLLVPFLIGAVYIHRFKVPNFPTKRVVGREMDDVQFTTDDGLTIRGWFIPAKDGPSERTVLICHGLGANRSYFLSFVAVAEALKANALLFDFRGHGDSDGHTITFGAREKLDVLAAIRYLRTERADQARQIVGVGISMGTSGLVGAAAEVEPPLDAVILDSPYASAVELTDNVLAMLPGFVRPLVSAVAVPLASLDSGCRLDEVRPIDQIAHLRAPLLVIHATGDQLIPCDHGCRLYEQAVGRKSLWLTDTGGHGSSFSAKAEYLRRVQELLAKSPVALTGPLPH